MNEVSAWVSAIKEDISEIRNKVEHIEKSVLNLEKSEAERRGREQAEEKRKDFKHDDRWQVWLRSLFPVAIITAAINAIIVWWNGQ